MLCFLTCWWSPVCLQCVRRLVDAVLRCATAIVNGISEQRVGVVSVDIMYLAVVCHFAKHILSRSRLICVRSSTAVVFHGLTRRRCLLSFWRAVILVFRRRRRRRRRRRWRGVFNFRMLVSKHLQHALTARRIERSYVFGHAFKLTNRERNY